VLGAKELKLTCLKPVFELCNGVVIKKQPVKPYIAVEYKDHYEELKLIYLLSPAKTLDYETQPSSSFKSFEPTLPRFPKESLALAKQLRKVKANALMSLMDISLPLAQLNVERFKSYSADLTPSNSRPAILAFNGDVYDGLKAPSLSESDVKWAQAHVRMLSGLYGLLRPLDLMQPYRLEMGTRFENKAGNNLYALWVNKNAPLINKDLAEVAGDTVINLASEEYFKSVDVKQLKARVVQPVFQERKKSAGAASPYKVVSFNAKRARGMMVRYAIENRIASSSQLTALQNFSMEGYCFAPEASSDAQWFFRREV
jgi:uncharacterized protein